MIFNQNLSIDATKINRKMSTSDTTLNTFLDFTSTFMFPIISTYDIIINIINIIIFSKKSLKDIIFKYYRINAISNICYLLIVFFLFVARCGVYCTFSKSYPAQLYLYVFYTYIIRYICYFKYMFTNNSQYIQRLFIACNKNTHFLKIKLNIIISSLIIFSAVFYSPILFTKTLQATAKNISSIYLLIYLLILILSRR